MKTHPVLQGSPYRSYVYAYPHKTAYRPIAPRSLESAWSEEPTNSLFLYVHVPFCTMRCGFCNLFTTPNPKDSLVPLYLDALRQQAVAVRSAMPNAQFSRLAIGGGTPTYLDEQGLAEVFDIAEREMGVDLAATPIGVETSPDTLTAAKAALLKERGVNRVSIGIQSFVAAETASVGRPQDPAEVDVALNVLKSAGFSVLNFDLIFGLPAQTVASWLGSIKRALSYEPNELYLYPLYVRPLTALGQSRKAWDDLRLACYREGRETLLGEGYSQVSTRLFRRHGEPSTEGPSYCCQSDGMVGLGCGARSYTRGLHYSLDYAVGARGVREIIGAYLAREPAEFGVADHGFELDANEQRRRFLLQSILHVEGLKVVDYRNRFATDPVADFPELTTLVELGLLDHVDDAWRPTPLGLERADVLGPWFFSERVRSLMEGYEAK